MNDVCRVCGRTSPDGANFCSGCGHLLAGEESGGVRPQLPERPSEAAQPLDGRGTWTVVAAVLLTLAAVFVVAAVWREQEMSARIDDASPLVMEIASLFLCPCPECGNHSVAECTCHMPGGGGHCRRRIAVLLDSGLTRDEVVLRLSAEWELMEAAQGEDSGASAAAEPPR